MADVISITSFLQFHFIFELIGIFMGMTNIIQIQSVNAAENCLLNFFSVRIFFH